MINSVNSMRGSKVYSETGDNQRLQTIGGLLKALDPKAYNAFSAAVGHFIITYNKEKNDPSPEHKKELENAVKILSDVFKVAKRDVKKILAKLLEMKELLIEVIVALTDPHPSGSIHFEGLSIDCHSSHAEKEVTQMAQDIAENVAKESNAFINADDLRESLEQLHKYL